MKRILTAVLLIPLVLLVIFQAPVGILAVIVAAVALLTAREFFDITAAYGVEPQRTAVYVAILVVFLYCGTLSTRPVSDIGSFGVAVVAAAALVPFVFLALAMRRAELGSAFPAAATSVFAFGYIGLPLLLLVQLRQQWAGVFLILYLFVVVWSGDTFAYYVGRSLGKHKMSPRVSPKKTWEGAAGSLVGSVALGSLMMWYAYPISDFLIRHRLIARQQGYYLAEKPDMLAVMVITVLLNLAAQLGDLVESAIKRGADVKDSGPILPGHGGLLDRIDALLFAIPVLWAYAAYKTMG